MIHLEQRDSVAVLRMEHGKVNAVDDELFNDLGERLDEVEASAAQAIVLTGTGSVFSAGVNLFKVLEGEGAYVEEFLPLLGDTLTRLLTSPLPVVAAVNGHAIAGGCVLACACDRRVMAEGKGRVGLTELLVGVPFPVAALETVRDLIAPDHVMDIVYRGRTLSGAEALATSLVDELVEPEALLDRACEVAGELGRIPRDAFALTKRLVRKPLLDRIEHYTPQIDPEVIEIWARPETHAVIRAFLEKTVGRK